MLTIHKEAYILVKKIYLYLKKDIEKRNNLFLIIEVIFFILLWSEFCFIQSIDEVLLSFIEYNKTITAGILLFFIAIFLFLFIITAFCSGEIIHRANKEIKYNNLLKVQKGWVLVESLVGIVILSTAIIALLLAFSQATKGTTASTNRTQATYLAQQTLENLKSQDGGSIINNPPNYSVGIFHVSVTNLDVSVIKEDLNSLSHFLQPRLVTVTWSDTSGGLASKNIKMVGYYYVNP